MSPALHVLTYHRSEAAARDRRRLTTRDGQATGELAAGVSRRLSLLPGERFFLVPYSVDAEPPGGLEDLAEQGPPIPAGDLVCLAGRPALDDARAGGKAAVGWGHTRFEWIAFEHWRRYLPGCSAYGCMLHPELYPALPARHDHLRSAQISQYGPCNLLVRRERSPMTAVYLLRVDELWPGGPGIVWAFGHSEPVTLAWAYRLAHDQAPLLDREGFTLAQLEVLEPDPGSADLAWAAEAALEVVLQAPLRGTDPSGVERISAPSFRASRPEGLPVESLSLPGPRAVAHEVHVGQGPSPGPARRLRSGRHVRSRRRA